MGNCFATEGFSLLAEADANAPIEVCWEVLQDIRGKPTFITQVDEIELLQKKGGQRIPLPESQFEYKEGALWRESGTYGDRKHESIFSITSLEILRDRKTDKLEEVTVRVSAQFLHTNEHKESVYTATHCITYVDETTCKLRSTMAFLPTSCLGIFNLNRMGKQARDMAQCAYQKIANENAGEAEKRYQKNKVESN